MKQRGVKPEMVRLALSEGDWIDVKKVLTVGEERDISQRGVRTIRGDGTVEPNELLLFLAAATYILNWSFVDYDGNPISWPATKPIEARVAVLRALDAETMAEIEVALEAHRVAQEGARKNVSTGESAPAVISPSVS